MGRWRQSGGGLWGTRGPAAARFGGFLDRRAKANLGAVVGALCAHKSFFQKTLEGAGGSNWLEVRRCGGTLRHATETGSRGSGWGPTGHGRRAGWGWRRRRPGGVAEGAALRGDGGVACRVSRGTTVRVATSLPPARGRGGRRDRRAEAGGFGPRGQGQSGALRAQKSFFQKTLEGGGRRNWREIGRHGWRRRAWGRGTDDGVGRAGRRPWRSGCRWVQLRQAQGRACGDAGVTGRGRRGGRPPDGATGPAPGCRSSGSGVACSWGLWYSN